MKRRVINKAKTIKCKICQNRISSYGMGSHLKYVHKISSDEYAKLHGEFRALTTKSSRNIRQIQCGICKKYFKSVGMHTHLRDAHNILPDEYVKKFPEYRPIKLRQLSYQNRLNSLVKRQKCEICNEEFPSGNLLGWHIKNVHHISKKDYILNHVFKGERPKCKCGCGRNVKILPYYPYKRDYISSHNPNPMLGLSHSELAKEKMSIKAMERITDNITNKTNTFIEIEFKKILNENNEPFVQSYQTKYGLIDFYLPQHNMLVEIDGSYWHPSKIEKLNFRRLPNVISDKQKSNLSNLIRIREEDLSNIKSIEDIKKWNYNYSFKINHDTPIIAKEFFEACLELKGRDYLKKHIWLLLKFLRILHPNFPYPPIDKNPQKIIENISSHNISTIFNNKTKHFSNNISSIGVQLLKHIFKSYWHSSYKGNKSPVDAWGDDNIMKQIISYRIGDDNSNEVFDFSLHQMLRGLSARRHTISFFKPLLAAAIYTHYLGENPSPIVFDPCCGFGGRLFGFKAKYPSGTYIGCEPNIETYKELLTLISLFKWKNVIIHNCKIEEFSDNITPDLIFTSIPYYDLETYSSPIIYQSFDHWKELFISKIISCSKLGPTYINLSDELAKTLKWNNIDSWISSNRSHFDTLPGKKLEPIVKLS